MDILRHSPSNTLSLDDTLAASETVTTSLQRRNPGKIVVCAPG